MTATKRALKEHSPDGTEPTESQWRAYLQTCFRSVWIGIAGLDRAGLQEALAPKLGRVFGLDETTVNFRLTTDVDLLPASVLADEYSSSVVVLIAGTGSVAMRYTWSEKQGHVRVARSGGWGHILGDEGGGYSIGLEAIKHTLTVLEEMRLGLRKGELGEFEHAIIEQLGCQVTENSSLDLLSDILSQHDGQSTKARIAGVAKTVLKLAPRDQTATTIVDSQVSCLVNNTLGRLVDTRSTNYVTQERTELVLAGGLIKDEVYQGALQRHLLQRGFHFRGIRVVDDVAAAGTKFLLSQ